MTFQSRLIAGAVAVSLPVALVIATAVDRIRMQDLASTLEAVVTLQINDQVKERCESDPAWFLTGPLDGRPRPTDPKPADPDALPPRPRADPHAYELFAYDDDYLGTSPAAPRFPQEFKNPLRSGTSSITAPFVTPEGTGAQLAIRTGWNGGPCQAFLGRMRPWPHQRIDWWLTFGLSAVMVAGVIVGLGLSTTWRIRRLSTAAREAARSEWTVTVPADGHDELTSVGATLNEASADLRRRIAGLRERDETHRRFLARTAVEIAAPLQAHEMHLGDLTSRAATGRADLSGPVREAHDLALHVGNLLAAAGLRMHAATTASEIVRLNDVVEHVVRRSQGLARVGDVSLDVTLPAATVTTTGDATLFEQALGNLVDNAIRYNRPGGHVRVLLSGDAATCSIVVRDDGAGVTEEKLAELTAIRRFRGDEGRGERVRQRGLGLAIVWEVADRFGLKLSMKHATPSGLEVELSKR